MIKFIRMINEIATTEYFLTDALGSVRQMTNPAGDITLVNKYEPYGTNTSSAGVSESAYGFTGEYTDSTGNIYLRARYYNPNDGRFISRDTWAGDVNNPLSLNRWMYVEGNPVNYVDPSGNCAVFSNDEDGDCKWVIPLIVVGGAPVVEEIVIDFSGTVFCPSSDEDVFPQPQSNTIPTPSPKSSEAKVSPKCIALALQISVALNVVKTRYNEWIEDRVGRHDKNHIKSYRQAQARLRNLLQVWNNQNCGALPSNISDANDWIDKPLP